jgi:peptide/nickel transport system permease protein
LHDNASLTEATGIPPVVASQAQVSSPEVSSPEISRAEPRQRFWRSRVFRQLMAHRSFVFGFTVVTFMTLVAIMAGWLITQDPLRIQMRYRFQPPFSGQFWFGTDHLGRDLYSRLVMGARVSLRIGFWVMIVSGVLGTIVGACAGYFRAFDGIIMRCMDALMAFPSIMLAIAIAAALGPSDLNVVLALSAIYVPSTARIVRASVLVVREMSYVEAAVSSGVRPLVVLLRHVLPNSFAPLIVQLSFIFAYAVLAEAVLSFLGVGTPPPTPSWGNIIADGRAYIREAPWITIIPGLVVTLTVLALNLLGDALRDVLDPRLKDRADV